MGAGVQALAGLFGIGLYFLIMYAYPKLILPMLVVCAIIFILMVVVGIILRRMGYIESNKWVGTDKKKAKDR